MATEQPKTKTPIKIRRFIFLELPAKKAASLGIVLVLFGGLGLQFISDSKAATFSAAQEAEDGAVAYPDMKVSGDGASQGTAVKFSARASVPPPPINNLVSVSTAAQLKTALADAKPGDNITLADGTYSGQFNSTKSGTAAAPITVTGSRNAVINGGDSGYTFSLGTLNSTARVSHWRLVGFTVTGGKKGVIFDNVQNSRIDTLLVQNTAQEGVHLRDFSSDNIIQNSTVTKTGLVDQQYGEGLYIGTAYSNWINNSQGKPDLSNNNQLLNNTISYTGAENIDIKEATHGGKITGNRLDGSGMCYSSADCNYADSLIDMKGEGWTISNNTAGHVRTTWSGAENDGFQVHAISQGASEGSGNNNIFSGNKVSDVAGYGFNIQSKANGVIVKCDNTVSGAGKGLSNITCQ